MKPSSALSDFSWAVTVSALFISVAAGTPVSLSHLFLCWAAGPVANLVIAILSLAYPRAYSRHRTPILAVLKLLRVRTMGSVYDQAGAVIPAEERAWPPLLLPTLKAGVLVVSALGFPLPLPTHLAVHSVALAAVLSSTPDQCAQETEAAPAAGQAYQQLAQRMGIALSQAAPLGVSTQLAPGPRHPPDPCMLLHCWVQLVGGFVLPSLIVDWLELQPPVWPPLWQGGRPWQLSMQPTQVALSYMGLLAVASVVSWQGLELVLGMWHRPAGAAS